jgi:very-short-patch-repair endonuclease
MRPSPDSAITESAAHQGSCFTFEQFVGAGGTRSSVQRRVRSGRWERVARGVFRIAGAPVTWQTRLWAAHLEAGPGSAICRRAAAQVFGMRGYDKDVVEVLQPQALDHVHEVGRLHETSLLPPEQVVRVDGFPPVTSVARTLFDLYGDPEPWLRRSGRRGREIHGEKMRRLTNNALVHLGLTVEQLAAVVATLAKRGRPGSALGREILAELRVDYVPTESELEDLFLSVVASYGLEAPERQVVLGTDQLVGRVDFVYRRAKLVVEVDGGRWHDGPMERDADRRRDNELMAAGWRVLRIRWRDLVDDPTAVVRWIEAGLRAAA